VGEESLKKEEKTKPGSAEKTGRSVEGSWSQGNTFGLGKKRGTCPVWGRNGG